MKLLAVGIGTPERGAEFCDHVGFYPENLVTDPDNAAYDALGLKAGLQDTFFNPETPYAILDRVQTGRIGDLVGALGRWKPWIPPKLEQGYQQGGALVFDGERTLYERADPSTGAHAPLDEVLRVALQ